MIPSWVYSIPYKEGGRAKDGADCWGLVIILYEHFFNKKIPEYSNITLPKLSDLNDTSDKLQKKLEEQNIFYEVDNPEFGDIIIFNVLGQPLHIGFALDSKTMIHTGKSHGVVIENFTEMKWKRKIAGFYRTK